MTLCLIGSALAGPASGAKRQPRKTSRVFEASYDNPSPIGAAGHGGCLFATGGCIQVPVGNNERYISVEVEDELGTDVFASAWIDLNGDQIVDETYDFSPRPSNRSRFTRARPS